MKKKHRPPLPTIPVKLLSQSAAEAYFGLLRANTQLLEHQLGTISEALRAVLVTHAESDRNIRQRALDLLVPQEHAMADLAYLVQHLPELIDLLQWLQAGAEQMGLLHHIPPLLQAKLHYVDYAKQAAQEQSRKTPAAVQPAPPARRRAEYEQAQEI
jgi:hypothetical protein